MTCGSNEVHVGDIGTIIRVTIKDENCDPQDISSASSKELIFKKPNCTIVTKTATFYTDGTDGIIQYTSESGFFDVSGIWQIQGVVSFGSGTWSTDIIEFRVNKNIGS